MGAAVCCDGASSNNGTSGISVLVEDNPSLHEGNLGLRIHDDSFAMLVQASGDALEVALHSNAAYSTGCRVCVNPTYIEEAVDDDGFIGQHNSSTLSLPGTALNLVVAPGDLLVVPGTGRMANFGVTGGLMGHVILVLGAPQVVHKHSEEGVELQEIWPDDSVQEIWRLRTLESTRANEGLLESECLLYVEEVSQKLTFCAEIEKDGTIHRVEKEAVEVWQSPHALRQGLRIDLMQEVVQDMVAHNAGWSGLTAMQAVFTSARIVAEASSEETMHKVLQSWLQRPICTSVAIIFWQRYLCKLAAEHASAESEKTVSALSLYLIMRWIPLKADCVLPGDLTQVLFEVGWERIISMPQVLVPLSAPAVVSIMGKKLPTYVEDNTSEGFVENQNDSAASRVLRENLKTRKLSEDETSAGGTSSDAESLNSD